ncbi:hypothetical protein M1349_00350 [Patescibacteria group bacterium]|nr:hypothetical protein [Patescibacteria group bacterium]
MEKPKVKPGPEWLIRSPEAREENCIMESERLMSVLPVAQSHRIEVTLLASAGETYPAPNYWRPTTDSTPEGAIHSGKGQINDGIVPEDSVYVRLSGETSKDLKDFWDDVRTREEEAKKIGTKA